MRWKECTALNTAVGIGSGFSSELFPFLFRLLTPGKKATGGSHGRKHVRFGEGGGCFETRGWPILIHTVCTLLKFYSVLDLSGRWRRLADDWYYIFFVLCPSIAVITHFILIPSCFWTLFWWSHVGGSYIIVSRFPRPVLVLSRQSRLIGFILHIPYNIHTEVGTIL